MAAGRHRSQQLEAVVNDLQRDGIRVSIFVDPDRRQSNGRPRSAPIASSSTPNLYARAFEAGGGARQAIFDRYAAAAQLAHGLGLGVNAGHDLDLENLTLFRSLPHLDEVSIGHALISHALYVGLDRAVRDYLATHARRSESAYRVSTSRKSRP